MRLGLNQADTVANLHSAKLISLKDRVVVGRRRKVEPLEEFEQQSFVN
uniref:Reductase_C domain-containing protein n=1 Tax=Ascaris lumbricoides TaxID=6252 RepID=A0A0M3I5Y0_ASCLU